MLKLFRLIFILLLIVCSRNADAGCAYPNYWSGILYDAYVNDLYASSSLCLPGTASFSHHERRDSTDYFGRYQEEHFVYVNCIDWAMQSKTYSYILWTESVDMGPEVGFGACDRDPYGSNVPQPHPKPRLAQNPDLRLASVEVGQVVWSPQIAGAVDDIVDLVAKKTATLRILPEVTGISQSIPFRVTVVIGSEEFSVTGDTDDILGNSLPIDWFKFQIPSEQTGSIQIRIDSLSEVPDSDLSNNFQTIYFHAHTVDPVTVSLVGFKSCAGANCPADVSDSNLDRLKNQAAFLSDVFPVPDAGMRISISDSRIVANYAPNLSGWMANLEALRLRKALEGSHRVVGVVPDDYFVSQGLSNYAGFCTFSQTPILMVTESSTGALSHELTHSFIFPTDEMDDYEIQNGFPVYSGEIFDGVNARLGELRSAQRSLLSQEQAPMSLDTVWMDTLRHELTFKKLSSGRIDPAILVVAGQVSKSGIVTVNKLVTAPSGYLSEDESGDIIIRAKNSNGVIISQTSIAPTFEGHLLPIEGERTETVTVELPSYPFAVAISAEHPIKSLEIVQNGRVVQSIQVQSRTLRDAIAAIPTNALDRKRPEHFRKLLLFEVEIVEQAIKAKIPTLAAAQVRILLKQFDRNVLPEFAEGALMTYGQVRAAIEMQAVTLEAEARKCKRLFCR